METSFDELKRKETVNLVDGKKLGKVIDVVVTYPEGRFLGIVVPGSTGFRFGKSRLFIDICSIKKIGVDVVLVDIKQAPKPDKKKPKWEDGPSDPCPPPPTPPPSPRYPQQYQPPRDRRDYGEYE